MENVIIIPFDNLDFSKLDYEFINLPSSHRSKIFLIKYINGLQIAIESAPIQITSHGIPNLNDEYYPTDGHREFINIPLDLTQDSCIELKKLLSRLDEYFKSDSFKTRIFGTRKINDYMYVPIVRSLRKYANVCINI